MKSLKTTIILSPVGVENLKAACAMSGTKTHNGAIESALAFYVAFLRGGIEHVHTCPQDPVRPGAESWVRLGSRCPNCGWEPVPDDQPDP